MAVQPTRRIAMPSFGIGGILAIIALLLAIIFWVVGKMTPEEAGVSVLLALAILL